MSYTVRIVSDRFPGEAKIVQLCSIRASCLPFDVDFVGYLDNSDPYANAYNPNIYAHPNPQGNMNIVQLDDSPGNGGLNRFYFDARFEDFVMFTPGGQHDIWVTLAKISWAVKFAAEYPSTAISPNMVIGPVGPSDVDEFPDWTEVWYNVNEE